jgi:hypothetical protein
MICRYCGLDTGSGVGHQSQVECIKALTDAISRARQLIDRARELHPRPSLDGSFASNQVRPTSS